MSWGGRPHQPATPEKHPEQAITPSTTPALPTVERGRATPPDQMADTAEHVSAEAPELRTLPQSERPEAPDLSAATNRGSAVSVGPLPVIRGKRPMNVEALKHPRTASRLVPLGGSGTAAPVGRGKAPMPRPVAAIPTRRAIEQYAEEPVKRAEPGGRAAVSRTAEGPAVLRGPGEPVLPTMPAAEGPGPAPSVSITSPVPFMHGKQIVYRDGQANYTPPRYS